MLILKNFGLTRINNIKKVFNLSLTTFKITATETRKDDQPGRALSCDNLYPIRKTLEALLLPGFTHNLSNNLSRLNKHRTIIISTRSETLII